MKTIWNTLLLAALGLGMSATLQARTLQGTVRDAQGRAVAGAIVTAFQGAVAESCYTNGSGSYRLSLNLNDRARLRARHAGFLDAEADEGGALTLRDATPQQRSDALAASAHAATLQWESPEHRNNFVSQCHYCHQIGNALTRNVKDEETWQTTLDRMQGYGALITSSDEEAFRGTLSRYFQGAPVTDRQSHQLDAAAQPAQITEWKLGEADSFLHDAELHPNGRVYAVDMSKDRIYEVDRARNTIVAYDLPPSELPLGGMFAGAYRPLGTFAARHGPHSIQVGPDGKLWTTNSLAAEVMSFDPVSHAFQIFPIPDAIYPHTLRFDRKGMLWFTVALSNKIGRFDPRTQQFTMIELPSHGMWRWLSDALVPTILEVASWFPQKNFQVSLSHHKVSGEGRRVLNLPYGIDVSPLDGSIWYSKLYSGYIGRVDPETLEVEEIESPLGGPRRLRFAPDGMLWIPSFEQGTIMRLDTRTRQFQHYKLPLLAEGEYETPYALGIDPKNGMVWITSNLSDRIFRLDPISGSFTAYPSPTRVTYMRDILFGESGEICSTNSNMPAYAIEGASQKVICLNPTGGATRNR
ncbi:MAG: carboxypeptidase regulatory-like domain-containing protein [Leptospirales bacterium]|nr:carboxypeptidase regulatory-like domain-containing protein [Leptospirales bacterium]